MRTKPISDAAYYLNVTDQEESILRLLSEHQPLSRQEISSGIQARSATNLSKSLQEMRRAGYITRDYRGIQPVWNLNPEHFASVLINSPTETYQAA